MNKINNNVKSNLLHPVKNHPEVAKRKDSPTVKPKPVLQNKSSGSDKVKVSLSDNTAVKRGVNVNTLKSELESKLAAFKASKTKTAEQVKVTYIPADKRHKGVSKYDNLPHFENRPIGFPDRYRAVNPKLAGQLEKDKTALYFPLNKGENKLVDGNGVERGSILGSKVKLNYAQVRIINGEKHYYAFSTKITDKNSKEVSASGWIKASAIESGNDPKFTSEDIKKSQPPAVSETHGKYKDYQQYEVRNIAPEKLTDENGKPKYGYMENGNFVSYKVLPKVSENNVAASDYLRREGNVINLGFNAAGLSNDTFQVDGNTKLVFHRAPTSVKSATVDIDLYHPKDKDHAGLKPVGKMRFVYGYVETKGVENKVEKRWGWMALGALEKKS